MKICQPCFCYSKKLSNYLITSYGYEGILQKTVMLIYFLMPRAVTLEEHPETLSNF